MSRTYGSSRRARSTWLVVSLALVAVLAVWVVVSGIDAGAGLGLVAVLGTVLVGGGLLAVELWRWRRWHGVTRRTDLAVDGGWGSRLGTLRPPDLVTTVGGRPVRVEAVYEHLLVRLYSDEPVGASPEHERFHTQIRTPVAVGDDVSFAVRVDPDAAGLDAVDVETDFDTMVPEDTVERIAGAVRDLDPRGTLTVEDEWLTHEVEGCPTDPELVERQVERVARIADGIETAFETGFHPPENEDEEGEPELRTIADVDLLEEWETY